MSLFCKFYKDLLRDIEEAANKRKIKVIISIFIFVIIFIGFYFCVDTLWFREDDIGTILNGIIKSWSDLKHIFSCDLRDFIVPVNYHRSAPNVLSAFYRPLQNIIYTIVYFISGLNPWAFYFTHVLIHAFNSILIFYLVSIWLPIIYSLGVALLCAFYPDVSWLTWAATLQNSLSSFLLLITALIYLYFLRTRYFLAYIFSGFIFFLSLLARENGILFPFFIFLGVYFFYTNKSGFIKRFYKTLALTYIFFISQAAYTFIRLYLFGLGTLARTGRNLFLRFPFLNYFYPVTSSTSGVKALNVNNSVQALHMSNETLWDSLVYYFCVLKIKVISWAGALICYTPTGLLDNIFLFSLLFFLIFFILASYQKHKKLGVFLFFSLLCGLFPGVLAYPTPRYINSAYPIFVIFIVTALFLYIQDGFVNLFKRFVAGSVFSLLTFSLVFGLYSNLINLKRSSINMLESKGQFDKFFINNKFSHDTKRFIVFCVPFLSDIQNIFRFYLKRDNIEVVHELFSTFAQKGSFGCTSDCFIIGVKYNITPIKGGYRLTSIDKNHCGWWLSFSDHPLKWVEEMRSYEWTPEKYKENVWYKCSSGDFMIHEFSPNSFITDVSFVFDKRWLSHDPVFVVWDTKQGEYKVINSEHLK